MIPTSFSLSIPTHLPTSCHSIPYVVSSYVFSSCLVSISVLIHPDPPCLISFPISARIFLDPSCLISPPISISSYPTTHCLSPPCLHFVLSCFTLLHSTTRYIFPYTYSYLISSLSRPRPLSRLTACIYTPSLLTPCPPVSFYAILFFLFYPSFNFSVCSHHSSYLILISLPFSFNRPTF